jgi:hypothetical protein
MVATCTALLDNGATLTELTNRLDREGLGKKVAMSPDGSKVAAIASGENIFTSVRTVVLTWTEQVTESGARNWNDVAVSVGRVNELLRLKTVDTCTPHLTVAPHWTEQVASGS